MKSTTRKLLATAKGNKSFNSRQRSIIAKLHTDKRAGKFKYPVLAKTLSQGVRQLPPTEKMSHIRNAKVKTMPYAKQHEWHFKGGNKRGSELRKSLAREFKSIRKTGSVGRGLKGYV